MLSRLQKLANKVDEKVRVAMAKSPAVAKLIEVVNEDPWGPTAPQMDEITELYGEHYYELQMEMQKLLEQRDVSWRKCYKTLLLIDHLARNLDARFVDELRLFNSTLSEIASSFRTVHGTTPGAANDDPHGLSVRERAKKVHELLTNEDHLREERQRADVARKRTGGAALSGMGSVGDDRFSGVGSADVNRGFGSNAAASTGSTAARYTGHSSSSAAHGGGGTSSTPASTGGKTQEQLDHEFALKLQAEEDARSRAQHRVQEQQDHQLALQLQHGGALPSSAHAVPVRAAPAVVSTTSTGASHGTRTTHAVPVAATRSNHAGGGAHTSDGFDDFVSARVATHASGPATTAATTKISPAASVPSGWDPFAGIDSAPKPQPKGPSPAPETAATVWFDAPATLAPSVRAPPPPTMAQPPPAGPTAFDFFEAMTTSQQASPAPAPVPVSSPAASHDPFDDFVSSRVTAAAPSSAAQGSARAW